jgi:hypothetical protein
MLKKIVRTSILMSGLAVKKSRWYTILGIISAWREVRVI